MKMTGMGDHDTHASINDAGWLLLQILSRDIERAASFLETVSFDWWPRATRQAEESALAAYERILLAYAETNLSEEKRSILEDRVRCLRVRLHTIGLGV